MTEQWPTVYLPFVAFGSENMPRTPSRYRRRRVASDSEAVPVALTGRVDGSRRVVYRVIDRESRRTRISRLRISFSKEET